MDQNFPRYPNVPLGSAEASQLQPGVQYPETQTIKLPQGPFRGSYVAGHARHAATESRTKTPLRLFNLPLNAHPNGLNGPSYPADGHRPLIPPSSPYGTHGPSPPPNGYRPLTHPPSPPPNGHGPFTHPPSTDNGPFDFFKTPSARGTQSGQHIRHSQSTLNDTDVKFGGTNRTLDSGFQFAQTLLYGPTKRDQYSWSQTPLSHKGDPTPSVWPDNQGSLSPLRTTSPDPPQVLKTDLSSRDPVNHPSKRFRVSDQDPFEDLTSHSLPDNHSQPMVLGNKVHSDPAPQSFQPQSNPSTSSPSPSHLSPSPFPQSLPNQPFLRPDLVSPSNRYTFSRPQHCLPTDKTSVYQRMIIR